MNAPIISIVLIDVYGAILQISVVGSLLGIDSAIEMVDTSRITGSRETTPSPLAQVQST